LLEEAKRYHLDTVGVSSTKRRGSGTVNLNGGWKLLFWSWSKCVCESGSVTRPRLADCVRLDYFGITGLHIEAQNRESVNLPVTGICRNAESKYQALVDEVRWCSTKSNKVSPSESTILMGDFHAHIGRNRGTCKGVIGRHGVLFFQHRGSQVYLV